MKTTAKLNPETRMITIEIEDSEIDAILQCAEIGIKKFYSDRIAQASTDSQKASFIKLSENALRDLQTLNDIIAQA